MHNNAARPDPQPPSQAALEGLVGVPWDNLTPHHQAMVRDTLHDPAVAHWDKLVHWVVHLLAYQGGYEGKTRRLLRRRATDLLVGLAEQGDPESQRWLGVQLMEGIAGKTDPAQAVVWLERALDQGDAEAAFHLGCLFEYHRGVVRRDPERSNTYFKLAKTMGHNT